jgi:hypothetical protein
MDDKINVIRFTESTGEYYSNLHGNLFDKALREKKATAIQFETLELLDNSNPSNVIVEVALLKKTMSGFEIESSKSIRLYKFRSSFIHQTDAFILDLKEIEDFKINLSEKMGFRIHIANVVDGEPEPFALRLYYDFLY